METYSLSSWKVSFSLGSAKRLKSCWNLNYYSSENNKSARKGVISHFRSEKQRSNYQSLSAAICLYLCFYPFRLSTLNYKS